MNKQIVKKQFNSQANNFSNWSITKNNEYMRRYFDFVGISENDEVLDVACGSGDFAVYTAKRARRVCGVDISDGMIKIAEKQARLNNLGNIDFVCHDVEHLPHESNSFTVVVCKSAFHHMKNYDNVFKEMIRCCRNSGRLSIQDIVTYDNQKVNSFFERLEKKIDISHHSALSQEACFRMFDQNNIEVIRSFGLEVELNFNEYLNHAYQSKENKERIDDLLDYGLKDAEIAQFFIMKNNALFFKRKVFLILGQKG